MKKVYLFSSLLLAGTFCAGSVVAQQHPSKPEEGEITVLLGDPAAAEDVVNVFVENGPKGFNDPNAPRFSIVGKDRKFYLGIGGYAKTTVSFDFGNPINNAEEFTTSAIPMNGVRKGNGGLLQFGAATSNLFANFVALPGDDNQIGAFINGNFLGNDYGFQLNFAYLTFRGFTVGYNYSLFSDVAAAAPTIDYENAPGLTIVQNVVVDYIYKFNKTWKIGIGAEMPVASATTDEYTYMVNQRIPDIPAYVQASWNDEGSWVRASAIMRNMQYRDMVADKNHTNTAWGVKLSGSALIVPRFTAYYEAAYGKGISSYFQDIYEGGLDMVPDAATPGKLKNVEAWGGYLGLQYNFTKDLFISGMYSHVRDYASRYTGGTTSYDNQYKYAQYVVGNVFWNLTSNVQMGVEYLWGRRKNMDGDNHHDNRIQTMMRLNF